MTVVAAVTSIFCKKVAISGTLIPGMRSLLTRRQKVSISWRKIPADQETFLRKGRLPKKSASKLKRLELNSTNLELKSKKTHSDCAKRPDPIFAMD